MIGYLIDTVRMAYSLDAQRSVFARNRTLYGMKFLPEISICQTLHRHCRNFLKFTLVRKINLTDKQ